MDSFYDVKGNEVSTEQIVSEFINNYNGSLTDFNEGSEIRNLLEAFAVYAMGLEERINDNVYVMDVLNADGEYLDIIAEQPHIDLERNEGVEATGYVLFTIQTALLEELLIPEGTVVTSESGLDFETVTDNYILPGETSRECMVQAVDVGVDGNIPANNILDHIDGYSAVDGFTVSNPEAFSGGMDYEEDEDFRTRILEHMALGHFGSKPYYLSMLMNEFPDAHDIYMDTSVTEYHAQVIPNTYEGSTKQSELVQEVMAYLSDDNNVQLKHTFNVVSPTAKTVNVYFQSTVGSSVGVYIAMSSYATDIVTKAKEVLNQYLAGGSLSYAPVEYKGLNIKEEFTQSDLLSALSEAVSEVTGVTVQGNANTLSSTQHKYTWSYP